MLERCFLTMAAQALCDRASRGATEKQVEATRILIVRQLDALLGPAPDAPADPARKALAVREAATRASTVST